MQISVGSVVSIRHDAQAPDLRGLGGCYFDVIGHVGRGGQARLELEGAPYGYQWVYREVDQADVHLEEARPSLHVVHLAAQDQVVWSGSGPRPDHRRMKVYVVGIGWINTYLCAESTRQEYGTYCDRLAYFRRYLARLAVHEGDEITDYRYVYAEDISQVRRCYPDTVESWGGVLSPGVKSMADYQKCKYCRKTKLVSYARRFAGLCAKCEALARAARCPDCETRLADHDFHNTEYDGVIVYAHCPGCGLGLVTRDGKEWAEAAEDRERQR